MNPESYDIIVVGAGPAGSALCIALKGSGLKVALLDKDSFPRDKICGDALSPDVINQLGRLDPDLRSRFEGLVESFACRNILFRSSNGSTALLTLNDGLGYVKERLHFDHLLFEEAKKVEEVTTMEGSTVSKVERIDGRMIATLKDGKVLTSKCIVAADGFQSVVKRFLMKEEMDRRSLAAGLRMYWENVGDYGEPETIELHFLKDISPGYFWIFPLPNNRANVGLGMLSEAVVKHNIDLKQTLLDVIERHPDFKERFQNARPLETPKGFGIPLYRRNKSISGDGFLLTGDAASLINPLTGEGIGNAIRSGRIAAEHLKKAFLEQRFDQTFNKRYDRRLYKRMGSELKVNLLLQRMFARPWLNNIIVGFGLRNAWIRKVALSGFSIDGLKKSLKGP